MLKRINQKFSSPTVLIRYLSNIQWISDIKITVDDITKYN